MENFPKALEYAGIAFDSAGTAEEKFNAYLEGTEASLNSLKAAFEGFARDTLSAGVIKDLVDFGTILLNLVNNPLTSFILKTTAVYAGLKLVSIAIKGIITHLGTAGLVGWLGKVSTGFALLKAEGLKATVAINGTKTAAQGAAAAMSALNLAIGAAALVITGIITFYQKAKQAHEEAIQKAKEHIETVDQESKSLESLVQQYKDLASSENYDDTTRESIKNIQEQINELIGDEKSGLDLVNGNLDEQLGKLRLIKKQRAENRLTEDREAKETLEKEFEKKLKSVVQLELGNYSIQYGSGASKELKNFAENVHKAFVESFGEVDWTTTSFEEAIDQKSTLENARKYYDNLIKIVKEYEDKISKETDETKKKELQEYQDYFQSRIDKLKEITKVESAVSTYARDKATVDIYDSIQAIGNAASMTEDQIKKLPKAQQNAIKAVKDGTVDTKEEFEALEKVLTEGKTDLEKSAITAVLLEYFPEFNEETESAKTKVQQLGDSIENLKSAYDTLTTALEDYNANGSFSLENFEKLMKLQPEYLGYLFDENGQIKDNTAALYDQIEAQYQEQAVQQALAWMDTLKGQSSEAVMAALAGETEAVNDLTTAYANQIKVKALSLGLDVDTTNAVIKRATAMANALSKINYGGGGKSSSGSAKKEEDKYAKAISYVTATIDKKIKALEKEKEAIEDVVEAQQEELDQYDKALSYINKYVSARIKELEDEKKALEDKNDETSREIELEELRNNLQKARQRTMRVYSETEGWTWQQNPEELRDAQKAMDDFQVENLTKAIDKLIEQWQEYLDLWEKIPDTYDEYAEELAFKESQGFITEQDLRNKNLSGLEKFRQAYFKKEKSITETTTKEIDKQIDSLNKLKDKWSNIKSDIEYQQNAIIAKELLGSSSEADILNSRIKNINTFANEYASAMNRATSSAESAAGRIRAAVSSINITTPKLTKQDKFAVDWQEGKFKKKSLEQIVNILVGEGWNSGDSFKMGNYLLRRTSMSYSELLQGRETAPMLKSWGFASGTKNSPEGIANVDENGNELIIEPPTRGRYTVLRDGSGVLPHNLTQRIFDVATNPINYMIKALKGINPNAILSNRGSSTNNNTNINISKIELPNVSNVDDFVKELQLISANR